MFAFAAAATTFANSVLPEPGGPSARMGFCICAARNTTFRVTGSATYLAAASFSDNCSIDANTGCAPAALILKHKEMESRFSQRGNIWRHKIVGERISRLKNGQTIRGRSLRAFRLRTPRRSALLHNDCPDNTRPGLQRAG